MRPVEITRRHVRGANRDLPCFTGRQIVPFLAHDAKLDACERAPHRAQPTPVQMVVPTEGSQNRRGLGKPVTMYELDSRKRFHRPAHPDGVHGRGTVRQPAKPGDVEVTESPLPNGPDDQGRGEHRKRGAALLHCVQECIRREIRQVGVRCSSKGERSSEQICGMEHRSNVQHHVVLRDAVRPHELESVSHDVAMGKPYPLGPAGSSAGVQQQGVVVLCAGPPSSSGEASRSSS